jgi:hypothetical protein
MKQLSLDIQCVPAEIRNEPLFVSMPEDIRVTSPKAWAHRAKGTVTLFHPSAGMALRMKQLDSGYTLRFLLNLVWKILWKIV